MGLANRITAVWWSLRENSVEGGRRRGRLGAGGGLAFLLSGFLVAFGFGRVVEIALAALVVGLGAAAAIVVASRFARAVRGSGRGGWIQDASVRGARAGSRGLRASPPAFVRARAGTLRAAQLSTSALAKTLAWSHDERKRKLVSTLAARVVALLSRAGRLCRSAAQAGRARLPGLAATCARALLSRLRQLARAAWPAGHAGHRSVALAPPDVHRQREALRLNAAGVQLRRDGASAQAAEQHRAALEIFRELGDARSVALTLNNLALALTNLGDDRPAIELFIEAAEILGELGDEQYEGQVIANLGLVHRRHGRGDEANNVLQLALEKLAPSSNAYRTVEAELRRAS